jgi:hypothetical protein
LGDLGDLIAGRAWVEGVSEKLPKRIFGFKRKVEKILSEVLHNLHCSPNITKASK